MSDFFGTDEHGFLKKTRLGCAMGKALFAVYNVSPGRAT